MCYETKDNRVFRHYTLIVGISTKGVIDWKLYEKGGMNSVRLIKFLKRKIFRNYKNKLLILDNAGCHINSTVIAEIKKSKNKLDYSVPYRPKTNVIESQFSQFKHYLKRFEGIIFNDLKQNVKLAIKIVKQIHYFNYAYNLKKNNL